jgi:TP901 family phage tail tape measure protein
MTGKSPFFYGSEMANSEIGIKLKVDFDVDPRKINVVVNALKNSLGPLGKDIKPIDGDKIAAELNKIQAETKETVTGINAVDQALDRAGGSNPSLLKTAFTFNQIQQSVVGLTTALSPFLDEFIELDKNIKNIGTLGRKDFQEFSDIALQMAADIPGSAADMANGIYQAISAGASGTAEEIGKFVEVAAKAGVAGLSDTTTAVNGLTSVLNAYGLEYEKAGTVADTFFAGIRKGKTTFEELNATLASFVPSASAMGVSFDQATAAIARLTAVGTPTAQAGTQLNAVFTLLAKGTAPLKSALSAIGTDLDTLRNKLKLPVSEGGGLVNVMRDIKTAADASGQQLAALTGRVEAAKIIESLAGDTDKYAESLKTLDAVSADIADGASSKAFDLASESIAAKADGFAATIQNALSGAFSTLGETGVAAVSTLNQIAPALAGASGAFVAFGGPVSRAATGVLNFAGSMTGVGTQIIGVSGILPKASLLFRTFWTAATGPIGLAVAGFAAVATGVYFLVDALHVSAEERLEEAKAEEELTKQQIDRQNKLIDQQQKTISSSEKLGNELERLGSKADKTAADKERMAQIQGQLIKMYPDAINGTQTWQQTLSALQGELKEGKANLTDLNEEMRQLQLQSKENTSFRIGAEFDVEAEKITDDLYDEITGFFDQGSFVVDLFGGQTNTENVNLLEGYTNAIKNAKDDTELQKAINDFNSFVLTNEELDPEDASAISNQIEKLGELRREKLKADAEITEQAYKNDLDRLNEQIQNSDIEFAVSDDKINEISEKFGVPVEEVQAAVGEMEKETRQSRVGEILAETSKVQGNLKQVTRLDDLVKAFNEAETDAQKAKIGDIIKEIAPDVIDATGVIETANGDVVKSYNLLGGELEKVKEAQSEQFGDELLSKQREFVSAISEEGNQYKENRAELDRLKAEISKGVKAGVDTSDLEAQFKKLSGQNQKLLGEVVQSTAELAKQGEVSTEIYEELGAEFGISGEALKEMVDDAQGLTDSIEDSVDSVQSLGDAYKQALEGAKSTQTAGVAALSELRRQLREGEISQEEFDKKRADIFANTKKSVQELKALQEDERRTKLELGLIEEKKKKSTFDLFKVKKDELNNEVAFLNNQREKLEVEQETSRIQNGRKKNVADELITQDRKLESLEKQRQKYLEIFQITEDSEGNLSVGLNIKSDEKEDVLKDYNKLLLDMQKGSNKQLELEAKLIAEEESLDEIRNKAKLEAIEYEVKIATDDESKVQALNNLKDYYSEELSITEQSIKETQEKLRELNSVENKDEQQRLELVALEKHLNELQSLRTNKEQEINSTIEKISEIRLSTIQEEYDKRSELLEQSYQREQDQMLGFAALNNSVASNIYDKQLNEELSFIDTQQKLREDNLSNLQNNEEEKARIQEFYNRQRLEKEREYAAKKQAIEQIQKGYELEQQNNFEVEKLALKQRSLEEQIKVIEEINPGSLELQGLRDELAVITEDINSKSEEFGLAKEVLSQGLADSLTAGFSGDTEKMKEGFRGTMQVSAGLLKAKAESTILALVLGEGEKLASLGVAGVFLLPLIKGLISSAVSQLINPVVSKLTSFSSGGRADSPTLAIVGDASQARPGADTEWILRDDQINYMLDINSSKIVSRLAPILVKTGQLMKTAVSRFADMVLTLGPKMNRNNLNLYNVTNYFNDSIGKGGISSDTVADNETMNMLKKQNFKVRRFASGLGGGAISEPELILAGDAGVPEYVVREDQLLNSHPLNAVDFGEIIQVLNYLREDVQNIHFIIDNEVIGQANDKYKRDRDRISIG